MNALILAAFLVMTSSVFATYNPATGTYTVDEHGCVSTPNVLHNFDSPTYDKQKDMNLITTIQ